MQNSSPCKTEVHAKLMPMQNKSPCSAEIHEVQKFMKCRSPYSAVGPAVLKVTLENTDNHQLFAGLKPEF